MIMYTYVYNINIRKIYMSAAVLISVSDSKVKFILITPFFGHPFHIPYLLLEAQLNRVLYQGDDIKLLLVESESLVGLHWIATVFS